MGNPKRLLQVVWGHVFMDASKYVCTYYTLSGREDSYCNTIIETSLGEIISNCLKFIEEETLLQTNVYKMGERRDHTLVDRTPKCHPDLYGEGIEYSWDYTKDYYRRSSLEKKECKKNSNKVSKSPYQDTNLPQISFVFL